jgi:hypothetical protein
MTRIYCWLSGHTFPDMPMHGLIKCDRCKRWLPLWTISRGTRMNIIHAQRFRPVPRVMRWVDRIRTRIVVWAIKRGLQQQERKERGK